MQPIKNQAAALTPPRKERIMPWKQQTSTVPGRPGRGSSRLIVAGLSAALVTTVAVAPVAPTANASGHHSRTDTYVSAWDALGAEALAAEKLSPPDGIVIFGYAGIAVYDAVMAVRSKYEPFAVRTSARRGASPEAAVVAAGDSRPAAEDLGAWVGRCGGKDGWQAVGPWHRPRSQWPRKGSYI